MTPNEWAWRRWAGFGIFVFLLLIGAAVVLTAVFRLPMGAPGMSLGMGFGWLGGLIGLLFFFWFLSWFARFATWPWWRTYPGRWQWHRDEATEILRARYARGELTKDQFDAMMRDLGPRQPEHFPWENR